MADKIRVPHTIAEALGKQIPNVRVSHTISEVLGALPPSIRVSHTTAEVLLRPINFQNIHVIAEVLGQQSDAFNPTSVDAVYQFTTQADEVPPPDQVISFESVEFAWSYVTTALPIDFPISYNHVAQSVTLVLHDSTIVTQSFDIVPQVWSYAVASARLGDYLAPDQYRSPIDVASVVNLVLISDDIPYTPTSGVFTAQFEMRVLQRSPLPFHRSNVYAAQQLSQVVQPLPIPMHRSDVFVAQQSTQVVTDAQFDDDRVGVENAGHVTSYAVQAIEEALPISPVQVPSYVNTALVASDTEQHIPLSFMRVPSYLVTVLRASDTYPVISRTRVASYTSIAMHGADYLPPINYLVWSRADAVSLAVVREATDYPNPNIPTATIHVPQNVHLIAQGADKYESPADMYEESQVQEVARFGQNVLRANPYSKPISYTPVKQYFEYITRSEPLPSPEDVANSGVRTTQIMQPVAMVAEYPNANIPVSLLNVSQVIEHVAEPAQYPDVHLPTSDGIVGQVIEHVAQDDVFPDPADMFRPLLVSQVIEGVAQVTDYPAWDSVHKPLQVSQVIQHFTEEAVYPDKDIPQSELKVSQVLEQVADIANYPDKDIPQSALRVRQMLETVMVIDRTMYVMPSPPRKHRVQITCRFVY